MVTLRATAIMKTDISGSTARFRSLPEQDLTALLAQHRDLVARLAAVHDGRIVKPEGDGFFLAFPSVTAGALAAMAMQEELRLTEGSKGDRRLAMRIVITLGDVLHQDGALVGDAVVLATRIEALTPPHEIYLSAAAWLAMNQAEIRTALVDAFTLKGFTGLVPVYRIEQTYRTRVIADQYLVITDLRRFSAMAETGSMTDVEKILDRLHALVGEVCRDFNGATRFSVGDSYFLTFRMPGSPSPRSSASPMHGGPLDTARERSARWCGGPQRRAVRLPRLCLGP
jgi:class 3 adenylate cyclase